MAASKRMFSKELCSTDEYLDMPHSTQNLYFHLSMEADDDGFVGSPKSVMRKIGASADDFNLLAMKGYIIPFEKGVILITHWKCHNYLRKDRYQPSKYVEERKLVYVLENDTYSLVAGENALLLTSLNNRAYTLPMIEEDGIPLVYTDKISKEKVREEKFSTADCVSDIISAYKECSSLLPLQNPNETAITVSISALLETYTKEDIVSAIKRANASPFLTGKTDVDFRANLAWILTPAHITDILNGKYDEYSHPVAAPNIRF